jgi:hypothetical protein
MMSETTDHANLADWGAVALSRASLKASPSLRVRCSGALVETIFYFTTKHTKLTEILN